MKWKLVSSIPLCHSSVFLVDTVGIDHCHSCEVGLLKISNEHPLLHTRWSPLDHFVEDWRILGSSHSANTHQTHPVLPASSSER